MQLEKSLKWGYSMEKAFLHSIESFGTVDGPGTRFVIFLSGCNLRCKYCHNPDTWKMNDGKEATVEELLEKYDKVKEFITGGITISGGDPLLQLPFLVEFTKEAKKRGIHICIDTSGGIYNPLNKERMALLDELIQNVDLFLLDIKHIDDEEHKKLTGISNVPVLGFARYLSEKHVPVWIRHVLVPTITLNDKYLYRLGTFLKELKNINGIEVLPYHTMAVPKYQSMKMKYPLEGVRAATEEEAVRARKIILMARNA